MFTMRLRLRPGSTIPPHTHPRDERVTVLAGAVKLGFGDVIDRAATTTFRAGSFYVNVPGVHHYLVIDEETELQLTGAGPWQVDYVKK